MAPKDSNLIWSGGRERRTHKEHLNQIEDVLGDPSMYPPAFRNFMNAYLEFNEPSFIYAGGDQTLMIEEDAVDVAIEEQLNFGTSEWIDLVVTNTPGLRNTVVAEAGSTLSPWEDFLTNADPNRPPPGIFTSTQTSSYFTNSGPLVFVPEANWPGVLIAGYRTYFQNDWRLAIRWTGVYTGSPVGTGPVNAAGATMYPSESTLGIETPTSWKDGYVDSGWILFNDSNPSTDPGAGSESVKARVGVNLGDGGGVIIGSGKLYVQWYKKGFGPTTQISNVDVNDNAAIDRYKIIQSPTSKTAAHTVTSIEDFLTGDATGGAFDFSLPATAGIVDVPLGTTKTFMKTDTTRNAVGIKGTGGDTIDGLSRIDLLKPGETVEITLVSADTWRVTDRYDRNTDPATNSFLAANFI